MPMTLQLAPGEPAAGPWRPEFLTEVIETLTQFGSGRTATDHRAVLAVDGRSSSGKTALAARMQDVVAESVVVHTDDIA